MSDGYCDVDFSDESSAAEPVEFFTITTATARKPYTCSECREVINVGDRYRRISYKFEGQFSMDRNCPSCAETAGEFDYHIFGGDLWAHLREQWDNGANVQGCINRLTTVQAKAHMHRQWLKWKGL